MLNNVETKQEIHAMVIQATLNRGKGGG